MMGATLAASDATQRAARAAAEATRGRPVQPRWASYSGMLASGAVDASFPRRVGEREHRAVLDASAPPPPRGHEVAVEMVALA